LQVTQVNSDWNATSGVAEILNKPTIPSITGLVAKSDYTPAHSLLVQQNGTGSPTSVAIGNNEILGRLSGGGSNIEGLSKTQVKTLLDLSGTNTGDNATNTTSNAYADSKVADSITNGVTTIAPSQNAVFDALALKQNVLTNPITGTGANGQVAFFNGTTTQAGDNGLFWDNTNKRLGIGTTSPGARLDVRAQGALSTDIAFRVRNSADTANLISVAGNGNVGIGTNAPLGRLDVSAGLATQTAGDLLVDTANNIVYIGKLDSASGNTNLIFRNRLGGVKAKWTNAGAGSILFGDFTNGYGVGIQQAGITTETTLPGNSLFHVNKGILGGVVASFINGSVLVGTSTDVASSQLTIDSTTKGFLPPRMTNAQRLAIASPAIGLMVYCTDMVEGLYVNKSTGWQFII
jgi:hypothetical protein